MLDLINQARTENGLGSVTLGSNRSAQDHAKSLLANNHSGHWGLDGLLPYMRYTLAGGEGYAAENVSTSIINPAGLGRYRARTPQEILTKQHEGLINSPGHSRNILNPWHTHVSLGIDCSPIVCAIVQLSEGNYVSFDQAPDIDRGILSFRGRIRSPFSFHSVSIWYHQSPHPLTLGQLDLTYSYTAGQQPAAFIYEPPGTGYYYRPEQLQPRSYSWTQGLDPYIIDPDQERTKIPPLHGIRLPTIRTPQGIQSDLVPVVVADEWDISGDTFQIKADLSRVLKDLGPGVYTVYIFGQRGNDKPPLTNYSVFVD